MKIRPILILLLLLLTRSTWAQQAVVVASMDSTQLLIGEQATLHLEIAADKNTPLQLPFIADTLMNGVEVLGISALDTTDLGNNRIQIKYDYLLTSFDSALYLLPPFKVIINTDTVYSNELSLKVSTVDVESGNYYDIKDILPPEFVWKDYALFIYLFAGFWILIGIILYILDRRKKHKSILPFIKTVEAVILPPHVRALQALDRIKAEKLWQHGKEKEYHSQVTDTLRTYIEERFRVPALEQTSYETLQRLRGISDVDLVLEKLKQILLLADLVKFAKYHPQPDENELSLMNAYLFVQSTLKEVQPVTTELSEEKEL
jgi:hypothetical protein